MATKKQTRRGVSHTPKAPKRKAVARKPALTKQKRRAGAGLAPARNRATTRIAPTTRRPDRGDEISENSAINISYDLDLIKTNLENYANHLRALDRKRLNGVGVKKQGFIECALELAVENAEFLPHWLTLSKFRSDVSLFIEVRRAFDLSRQVSELLWNIVMETADMAYTDALEFYSSVREAAKRRVDAAETVNNELREFFRSHGRRPGDQPTENEIRRDMNALLKGRKDGKVVVENFNPRKIGGERKLIDETD